MRFNVAQLLKEGVGSRRSYALDETVEALPETGTTRVRGEITVTCIDKGIWVSGPVETNASSMCVRCLNLVEEGAFTLDSHHTLDLTEAIRQYAIINLPMKPLCRQNCAGLCSTCGADLNNHQCDCSRSTDSRWSPLLDLLTAKGMG